MVQVELLAFEKQGYKSHHFFQEDSCMETMFLLCMQISWLEELTENDIWHGQQPMM